MKKGYLVLQDGRVFEGVRFGAETDAGVRAFQRAMGLAADGMVGKDTWTALLTR